MATTIITKHGTGVPTSLAVGELAIDKSEPAIYTNTGSGVAKIAGSASSGGGGIVPLADTSDVTFSGTLGSSFELNPTGGPGTGFHFKPNNSNVSWSTTSQTVQINAGAGKGFIWYHGGRDIEVYSSSLKVPDENKGKSSINRIDFVNVYGTTETMTAGVNVQYVQEARLQYFSGYPEIFPRGQIVCESIRIYGGFNGKINPYIGLTLVGCAVVYL